MPDLVTYMELRASHGIGYSRKWIAILEAKGMFPKRVQLGEGRIAWVEQEVKDWIETKKKART